MKNVKIAFDCDDTLVHREGEANEIVANEAIRTWLVTASTYMNTWIHVWSGSGELYARQIAQKIGITDYVDSYSAKTREMAKIVKPDVTVDDQEINLGTSNICCDGVSNGVADPAASPSGQDQEDLD